MSPVVALFILLGYCLWKACTKTLVAKEQLRRRDAKRQFREITSKHRLDSATVERLFLGIHRRDPKCIEEATEHFRPMVGELSPKYRPIIGDILEKPANERAHFLNHLLFYTKLQRENQPGVEANNLAL